MCVTYLSGHEYLYQPFLRKRTKAEQEEVEDSQIRCFENDACSRMYGEIGKTQSGQGPQDQDSVWLRWFEKDSL
jgi:hypothetical protein